MTKEMKVQIITYDEERVYLECSYGSSVTKIALHDDFYGLKPEYISIFNTILLGYNFKIYMYNIDKNLFEQIIQLNSLFFAFLVYGELIIVICECNLYVLNSSLNIKKVISFDDIIKNWEISDDNIKVYLYEGKEKLINLKSLQRNNSST